MKLNRELLQDKVQKLTGFDASYYIILPDPGSQTFDKPNQWVQTPPSDYWNTSQALHKFAITNDKEYTELYGINTILINTERTSGYTIYLYDNVSYMQEDLTASLLGIPHPLRANDDDIIDFIPMILEAATLAAQCINCFELLQLIQKIALDYIKTYPDHDMYACQYLPVLQAINGEWVNNMLYTNFIKDIK